MYEERTYRKAFSGDNLIYFEVIDYETDLKIGAQKNLCDIAKATVAELREQLQSYIKEHNNFLTSFVPINCSIDAPLIVQKMCRAAKCAGVGPMAAVAGGFSELVGLRLLENSDEVVVENGGDIFMFTKTKRVVGIYAGKSILSNKIGLEIPPNKRFGLCTSSGTVGHSKSFGMADAAVVLSEDTFLADACATSLGNMIKGINSIEPALNAILAIPGILGALVIVGNQFGAKGEIKLV